MLFDSFEAYDVQAVRRESREQGKIEGALEKAKENILLLLEDLGVIPDSVKNTILNESSLETLKIWFKYAARAENIEDFEKKMNDC